MNINKEKKITIFGVSRDPEKFGHKIFKDMIEAGYDVSGVGIREGEVSGKKVYKDLDQLGFVPDLVISVVPPKHTLALLEKCKQLNIKEIWMQPGSESEEAIEKASSYGMDVVSNACFMIQSGTWKKREKQ